MMLKRITIIRSMELDKYYPALPFGRAVTLSENSARIFSLFSKNPPKDLCKTTDKYSKKRKVISKRRSSYAY